VIGISRILRSLTGNALGIVAILVAMAAFVLSDTTAKLVRVELPVGQVMALRGVVAAGVTGIIVWWTGALGMLRRAYSPAWTLRNLGEVGSALTFLAALAHMPLAAITAITQATPLATTAAGALFLGERVGWRRWTATLAGFLGVLMIVRPGGADFTWWSVVALGTVLCVTLRDIATRRMDRSTPPMLITFVSTAMVMLAGFAIGYWETWVWPAPHILAMLVASAFLVLAGIYCTVLAVRAAELSQIAPFRYSIILWSILLGWLVWGDVPDGWTTAGIAVVVTAGLYTFVREQYLARVGRR
jgi:drug/metabolite transporter (DMT)-like permease